MLQRGALICGLLLWGSAVAAPPSASRGSGASEGGSTAAKDRRLTGKFLHITDLHPDPHYKTYSSTTSEAACHRQNGPAGVYGAETSGCDSPYSLINQTFQWIHDNIKDDIDFVIWTGDSARHDNDEALPRTPKEVIRENEYIVSKFGEVFGDDEDKHGRVHDWAIPIVPTFGNNDVMPHNIFLEGPNRWTKKYLEIWRGFIPEEQRHQFQQGGWFTVDVIPSKLAVISLNTIYFFSSNSAADGCANKREPGYEHMEWLRIQLQILRDRGMKAILIGHVPPARVDSKESWDETCWQKYTLWQRQFRDVIVGGLYGHMNIDHFMLQDFAQISKDAERGRMSSDSDTSSDEHGKIGLYEDGEITVASASDYLRDLREAWAQLPAPPTKSKKNSGSKSVDSYEDEDDEESNAWNGPMSEILQRLSKGKPDKSKRKKYLEEIGGKFAERYSITHVAPSVVPNYFPTLRIIEYNITGLENTHLPSRHSRSTGSFASASPQKIINCAEDIDDDAYVQDVEAEKKKKKKKPKGPRKYKFKVPNGPSKSSPPGPAYSPQTFTFTRYTQYFANLTRINNDFVELDSNPVTPREHSAQTIFGLNVTSSGHIDPAGWKEGKHGKHQGKKPREKPHPKDFVYEVEYDTSKDGKFPDLTVRRWVEYAHRIGRSGAKAKDLEYVEDGDGDGGDGEDGGDGVDEAGKKHKKKHKKHKKKHHKASREWYTFVRRAFVGTMDPHEIKQVFGAVEDYEDGEDREADVWEGVEL
ncbi:Endopolyphosphatase [Ophiobolus disseminans]|uniref:Endopolyphosphatase n=1 Tax=Ophiobolus disseminans TaxID=1469910 RepID=A0A6A7AJG2_9PLEO|nr:Endopolyphosphatase [Ophiobolus disseminans]